MMYQLKGPNGHGDVVQCAARAMWGKVSRPSPLVERVDKGQAVALQVVGQDFPGLVHAPDVHSPDQLGVHGGGPHPFASEAHLGVCIQHQNRQAPVGGSRQLLTSPSVYLRSRLHGCPKLTAAASHGRR
eukprot:12182480-Alexandrium_andersonii.AAC.1